MDNNQGYRKLVVFQNADILRQLIYKITTDFPKSEYKRVSQMRDAARSVKQNIVEGYYRSSIGEFIRFLEIGKASLGELGEDIDDCLKDRLIVKGKYKRLQDLQIKTMYLFDRLLKSLYKKQKDGTWKKFNKNYI